ncbi:hypothetical protein [Chryseobacterium sp. SIMBA_028]|uniref:hypothetical protein n=1 Tax=Chryseobacterium sp. SIMBA_028 TaxID=3085771 RepID=UPI00397992F9
MKDQKIINISKSVFGVCFSTGSICLLGGLITGQDTFAIGGYLLLIFGTPLNLLFVLGFLIYGWVYKSSLKACIKAISILCINIPIAIIYTIIGLNII